MVFDILVNKRILAKERLACEPLFFAYLLWAETPGIFDQPTLLPLSPRRGEPSSAATVKPAPRYHLG
jgi:hypothetical protein